MVVMEDVVIKLVLSKSCLNVQFGEYSQHSEVFSLKAYISLFGRSSWNIASTEASTMLTECSLRGLKCETWVYLFLNFDDTITTKDQ